MKCADCAFQNRYKWIQKHSTPVMTAGRSQKTLCRMQQIADDEDRKLCFEGCNHPVAVPVFVCNCTAFMSLLLLVNSAYIGPQCEVRMDSL